MFGGTLTHRKIKTETQNAREVEGILKQKKTAA
jgi:hypothetical protein